MQRRLSHQTLERRELLAGDLGPQLVSVAANSGENFQLNQQNILRESPTQLTFRFDGSQQIDAATLNAITIERSGGDGSFDEGNEIRIQPGFLGFGESERIVIARFAERLPDDSYRISIAGYDDTNASVVGLRNTDGELFRPLAAADPAAPEQQVRFRLELGPQVVAVVPQPITGSGATRIQQRDQIHVYFNEDPLSNPADGAIETGSSIASVVQPQYYNLFLTGDTVENTDDVAERPIHVSYDPALNRAVLTFASDLSTLTPDGAGTFRLRVGSSQALPGAPAEVSLDTPGNDSSSFATAHDLAVQFNADPQSVLISGEIEPTSDYPVRWPGVDAPGTRDHRRDPQLTGQPDSTPGINRYYYNFGQVYGTDPFNNVLDNAITDAQKQRTREILALYSQHLGVEFIETESRGLQIVTGDLRALVRPADTGPGAPYHDFRLNDTDPTQGVLVLDAAEDWFDGYGLSPDDRPSWFVEALRGIGSLLGIGHTFDQVPGVASGSNPELYDAGLFPLPNGGVPSNFSIEPDFLSTSDILPGQALHRPESRDVDLYRFNVAADGRIAIETFAQRLDETSLLDTDIKLWKFNPESDQYDLVARNDDYYSNDSFIGIDVSPNADGSPARYVIGITASGNENYNPATGDSGMGGRSQGAYQMRVTFQNTNVDTIRDTNDTPLDGDGDGTPGGDFNFWFRTAKPKEAAGPAEPRTLFVDKAGVNAPASGSLNTPYRTIAYAFSQARPGDIVRILPSAGADGLLETHGDNLAYEIGRGGPSNNVLSDGETFNVPRGVTVMIDAGTIIKLRGAKISVGSERIDEDRSLAALQVLGVPVMVDAGGTQIDGQVIFTSYQDESVGVDTNPLPTSPTAGQWAGIEFRGDVDASEGRPVWETEGIFLDYVAHADIRYGGGSVGATEPIVTALQMVQARPTLIHNTIRFNSDAAISADPNSFAETNFHAPLYQRVDAFTSDYDRVGPDIRGNTLVDNSINGLFIRVQTPAAGQREPMTVSGRFDDADITHVLSEVLVLQGQPGGPLLLENRPDVLSTTVAAPAAPLPAVGTLPAGQTIDYRVTFVTTDGRESLASEPTRSATVGANRNLRLNNLPQAPADFAGRRLYRLDPVSGDYVFVTQLDRNTTSYLDTGTARGGVLSDAALASSGERLLPRFDARLSIDPGLVIKLDSARIETGVGADFYAEGTDGKPIVFTSRLDDQYGAGGTFDTNNDGSAGAPQPGGWSGLVFRQGSTASLDDTIIRYAGGSSAIEGGVANFNPVEILQADVRIANSILSENASGHAPALNIRDGIGFNDASTIFVRGAQPVIVNNVIRDNLGAAISVNPDALNYLEVQDRGRSTGAIDRFSGGRDNQGPLVSGNRLANNALNGMLVRNEALTTESVWDDTDIVHVVQQFVYAWNHHHRSGLRLKSHADQSLVVKFQEGGALVADRYLNDVEDSIGGTIQVIGQPGFPVVLSSIHDDSVGAGFTPGGLPQNNTDNTITAANAGDWYGIVLRSGANDRNVGFVLENEPALPTAAAINALPATSQIIGSLATGEQSSDENRRLGFNIRGTLSQNSDLDVYSFTANGQTEVFIDIDDTRFGLDTIVELIDINGNILALSQSSQAESTDPSLLVNNLGPGQVLPLHKTGQRIVEGPNSRDAGMRVILPGNSATVNQYYVRIRSSNLVPGDGPEKLLDASELGQGLSSGQYQLSIRLNEGDEIAGSTVRLADIRYATHAIDVPASPFDSPLAAEFAEQVQVNGLDVDGSGSFTNAGSQNLGSLNESHRRVLRVSGFLGNNVANSATPAAGQDIDVYRVDLFDDAQEPNIINENRFVSAIFDIDYADQLGRANTRLSIFDSSGRLILHGLNSNVADDQGRPRYGIDMENLDGGSAGTLDSYIGPVELKEGSYYVVVSSAQMTPEVLNQYFNSSATATNVRMLPVDSVRRIAEEGFEDAVIGVNSIIPLSHNQQLNTTAERPTVVPLFDDTSIVPYSLEDVRMFITLQGGLSGSNQSTVITIDPFTGQLERTIGQFGQPVGDVAIRRDGELFAYSHGPQTGTTTPANAGNYLNISAADASVLSSPDDAITFRRNNEAGTNTENDPNAVFRVNAMSYQHPGTLSQSATAAFPPALTTGSGSLTVVGDRSNAGRGEIPVELRQNLVFSMLENNGAATNSGSTAANSDRTFPANAAYNASSGPASNKFELGIADVGQFADSDPEKTGGSITGLAQTSTTQYYAVTNAGGFYSFNPNSRRTPIDPSTGSAQFNYNRVINTTFHGTIPRNPAHAGSGAPQFSSVTLGPQATEGGRYSRVFFATTNDGWLYTFSIDPATGQAVPAPVLAQGNSAIPITTPSGASGSAATGGRQVTGVAFSIREENPWHQTGDRSNTASEAHNLFQPHNNSRIRTFGGSSLYFGFEPTTSPADNTLDRTGTGNLTPGGVHGSTVSRPFSLEGYSPADQPTLYFNYFLETESSDFTSGGNGINNQQVDSFRVFAAGDDGQWRLVGTNNSWRSFSNALAGDEYDHFATNGGIPVQELHDSTNAWRQARVDLAPLAGHKNVQLRFDFSTAGGMQSQFRVQGYQTEIQAVPGTELVNGSTFTLQQQIVHSNQPTATFEFVRGAAINLPAGNALLNGQVISIVGDEGTINLTLTTDVPSGPNQVGFARGDSAAVIAAAVAAALNNLAPELQAESVGGQLRIPEANSFSLTPQRFGHAAIALPADVSTLDGQSLTLANSSGHATSLTLRTSQQVAFSRGGQTVRVTANTAGAADGVAFRFVDNAGLGDVAPQASYNAGQRLITVTYNSAAATATNRDFAAVVSALDGLTAFSAALTAGSATAAFTPPLSPVAFPQDEVFFNAGTDTALSIAARLATRFNAADPRLLVSAAGGQLTARGASGANPGPAFTMASFNPGTTNSQLLPSGNTPVFYTSAMTDVQVRDAIRQSLAIGLGVRDAGGITQASAANYPGYATNRIRVYEQALLSNNSAVGFSTHLPGDEFGAFASQSVSSNQVNTRPGSNNSVEGVYIDDIVIGFASRGETVYNAPVDRDFVIDPAYRAILTSDNHQPEYPDEILVGGYTLEVRGAPTYGVLHDYGPIELGLNEQASWGRSFDVNDRFNPGAVTLNAPAGRELTDGETFVISNGTRSVTFEFDSNGAVAAGNVRVPFVPVIAGSGFNHLTDSPAEVARAIRDAINSPQARNVLGITAAGGDSRETGAMTGNRVELFGDVIHINPSQGRFLLVDMVAESTPYGRESYRTLPQVDHENETVENVFMLDSFTRATVTQYVNNSTQFSVSTSSAKPNLARATVTQYTDGQQDTLVAKGKIGDTVVTGLGNERIVSDPLRDVDVVKIYLNAGDSIDAAVDTNRFNRGAPFRTPRVQIFADDADQTELADSLTFDPLDIFDPNNPFGAVNPVPFDELALEATIDGFVAPSSGYYFVAVSTVVRMFLDPNNPMATYEPGGWIGQYQLTIRPSGTVASEPLAPEYHLEPGDTNVSRGQGQLVIESNFISDFASTGVRATYSGDQIPGRPFDSPLQQQPGGTALLRNQNTQRLLPGTVISNNVITATAGTGILYSGITHVTGAAPAPVPFGRIVNNTVVGAGSGTGINVTASTSPTVLNNVISGFNVGLNIAADSNSTVENANAFYGNTTALSPSSRSLADQSFIVPAGVELFEDADRRIYIPAGGSQIIDSSFASLNDRATFLNTVKQPMGIAASPIISPIYDAFGIPRVDDPTVTTPGGIGSNVFIDRGGIDRADFIQPTSVLVSPIDYIGGQGSPVAGGDIDPDPSFVQLPAGSEAVSFFEIQLLDPAGTGPDVATITQETVILTENGITLTPGVDYTFGYSDNSRVIRLTPLAGLWRPDAVYEVTLNNKDRISLTLPSGSEITDGDQYLITDSQNRSSVFEFDSGNVLQVPQTLGLEVLGPNTFFRDGDVFRITAPDGTARNFEINLSGAVASGNVAINLASAGTIREIRDVILTAISASGIAGPLDLAPQALGSESLQIGSLAGHSITGTVQGLAVFGTAAGITAGQTFGYQVGPDDVLFEFTDGQPQTAGAVAVPFRRTDSVDEIAESIAATVLTQPLGLASARAIGDGRVLLGGTADDVLTTGDSALSRIGAAGVTGALSLSVPQSATAASLEGQTFMVQNGNVTVTFVFTTDASLSTPHRRVVLDAAATPQQIAAGIASEINTGFVGALSPAADGQVVTLGEQAAEIANGATQVLASINTGTSPLVAAGVSGGAIAVPFIPSGQFSPSAAAATLSTALTRSPLGVDLFTPGGGTLLMGNTSSIGLRHPGQAVQPAGQALPAVTDLAGNPIESNRDNDETRFTIIMPEVRFDFGDAPDSYGTTLDNNGARHSVGSAALPRLGRVIDTEPDGQPSPASDDAVTPVTASSPGGAPLFAFAPLASLGVQITISDTVVPASGDRVRIAVGEDVATFELVSPGVASLTGNIAVPLLVETDTAATIAARLADAIRSELAPSGRAVVVEIDSDNPAVIRVETLDDEDGINVGMFDSGSGSPYTVFLRPGAPNFTSDPSDVLGFLNPMDPAGANIAVTVTGSGLLDAWIDFNGDGIFDPSREQVLTNVPVVDGVNVLNIITPEDTADGTTWARFRLSTGGNLRPTGVAVGGEVEDYQVQIIGIPLPTPQDDAFTINEDTVLDTTTDLLLPSLIDNDTIPPETFVPVQFFVGQQPQHGTLTILDPTSGRFIYEPLADFSGVDTFTYRLSTQANAGATDPTGVTFATVTINVRPVNDPPQAVGQGFVTLENTPVRITAAELLADAVAHENPQFPVGAPAAPWDESNQSLRVVSLQAIGLDIDAASAADANGDPVTFETERGSLQAFFDAAGSLIDVLYTPRQDLNRDNVEPIGSGPVFDNFTFTIQDDGLLIDPVSGAVIAGTPLTATATASIDVAPRNSAPTLFDDLVSVGIVGERNPNTAWSQYFIGQGIDPADIPVPTEDQPLVIPAAFLLQNDLAGSPLSLDENQFVAGNDGPLSLVSVAIQSGNATVEIDADGNVVFTPPSDIYGDVVFTYVATDQGIDEALDGTRSDNPLTSTGTVTVTLQPVNDAPVAQDRSLHFTESAQPGVGPAFVFTRQQLILGSAGETAAVPGEFDPDLGAPFDEREQFLNVVQFTVQLPTGPQTVDAADLNGVGTETLTLDSPTGGRYEFDFVDGIFQVGRFIAAADYSELSPFDPIDTFTYRIEDDGRTTRPQGGGVVTLAPQRSAQAATVTISVAPNNDAPQFDHLASVDVLERDDLQGTEIPGFATNILPGPETALDELERQTVSFTILGSLSTVPAGLMTRLPEVSDNGTLTVYPAVDAVGTAVYVVEAIDAEPGNDDFVPRTTRATFTVNVRPVNDPPRVNAAVAGTSQVLNADEGWSVNSEGVITYTLKEDNTQGLGVTEPFIIDMRRELPLPNYARIGLLDVFTVGPPNEADGTLGGSQVLSLLNFSETTALGGTIEAIGVDGAGNITQLQYTPPRDYNSLLGGVDSFTYMVQDNNPANGETWDLDNDSLGEDRRTATGRVEFVLRPVNDPPQFELSDSEVAVLEDSGTVSFLDFAYDIYAGPPDTAFDEIDPVSGQTVSFSVSAVSPGAGALFAQAPTVNAQGTLTFRPAANAYGTAVFELRATDDGADNAVRGDIVSSSAKTFTINIRPVNDPPVVNSGTPVSFTLNEDATILQPGGTVTFQGTFIPLRGDGAVSGLLDVFDVGPANEAGNITPGGNQSIRMTTPIPASTTQGGTLTRVFDPLDPSILIGLRYTPRANFNGTDSFIYGVVDDGVSVDVDGNVYSDPREAFNTVTLNVLPLNDRPQFAGALPVSVQEDAETTDTIGRSVIPNFVTDIAAGPAGAVDELQNQTVQFVVSPLAGNPSNLFASGPEVSSDGTLTFQTVRDANGVAVFTIQAVDSGPNNPPLEFNTSSPLRTFTITVNPVNDAPTFTPTADAIDVAEDSGPFTSSEPFATHISPGPADEVAAGQTVRFEVSTPAAAEALFQSLPLVTDNGYLRFTPAENAVGTAIISIVAIDSEGAASEPALVTITIGEINDVPVAGNVTLSGDEDTLLPIPAQTLLDAAFDPDLETNPEEVLSLTEVATTSQSGATIRILPSGDLEYDPRGSATLQALRPGQTLQDTFTYRVRDAAGTLSNRATVTISVAGINDAPTVRDDFATLNPDGPTVIRPLANDFDVDGAIDPLSLQITMLPAFGSVAVQNDGTLIYTPFPGFRGTDTIRYSVADTTGARSEQATITIDINQAPVAANDLAGTYRGRAVEIDVAANDTDPEGSLNLDSIEIVTQPSRGAAIVLGGGIIRYLPGSDFIGVDTFEYIIRDDRGRASNVGQVRVQVVASELQNPSVFSDVNGSGETTPLDALLILNRLARAAREGIIGGIPVELLLDESPRLFYDVSGNRRVEPLDALLVINEIARQNRERFGAGEQLVTPDATPAAAPPVQPLATGGLANEGGLGGLSAGPLALPAEGLDAATDDLLAADFTLPGDDVITALAIEAGQQETQRRRERHLQAIDAAWSEIDRQ